MPLSWYCTDAGSTAYWSLGGGWTIAPVELDGGTLNSRRSMPAAMQWPAIRKPWLQSSIRNAVQPAGSARAERGSLASTRPAAAPQTVTPGAGGGAEGGRRAGAGWWGAPQLVSAGGGGTPTVTCSRRTRLGRVLGSEIT